MRRILIAVVLCLWFASQPARAQVPSPRGARQPGELRGRVDSLLIESYLLGKEMTPEDRASHLVRLAYEACKLEPPLGRLWAEELFRDSFDLPVGWNRVADEKNALVALSNIDPVRAFELFPAMDTPVAMDDGSLPEDVRADAARVIFPRYWEKSGMSPSVLEEIRERAAALGGDGEYPYLAMSEVIRKLPASNSILVNTLFSDALGFYARGSQFGADNTWLIAAVKSLKDVVPPPLLRQALVMIVERLSQQKTLGKGEQYQATVVTDEGVVRLNSPSERQLLDLLPLIRQIDPQMAEDLEKTHPELRNGGNEKSADVAYVNTQGATQEQVAMAVQQSLQSGSLNRIESLAPDKPDEALALTASLSDPEYLSMAFASVAQGLASKDPERARKLLDQSKGDSEKVKDKAAKVRALTAVAEAAAAAHDLGSFADTMKRAFSLGREVFEEDLDAHPGKPLFTVRGLSDLQKLAELGVRIDASGTLPLIDGLNSHALKAYLLVPAADALMSSASDMH